MSQAVIDRQHEDVIWALSDPAVQGQYGGQYVVPFERRIVAHGMDLDQVLREAVRVTGRPEDELPHCAILEQLQDVPH